MTSTTAHNTVKLPPIHPGEILNEEFLLSMNITRYRLAKAIGVDARQRPLHCARVAFHHG